MSFLRFGVETNVRLGLVQVLERIILSLSSYMPGPETDTCVISSLIRPCADDLPKRAIFLYTSFNGPSKSLQAAWKVY